MMKAKNASWLVVLFLSLVLAGVALAQPAVISRSVMGGGGEQVSAGSYILAGTLAEPVAGDHVTGDDYQLTAGFWAGVSIERRIYLPLVLRSST
jgi:hypothetical protein